MNSMNLKTEHCGSCQRQSGLTLIELMVAMLIGIFLTFGSITVYIQSKKQFMVSDSIARLQENLRYAIDVIEPDVRLADFWGLNNSANSIDVPAGIAVICGTNGANASAITIGDTGAGNFALQADLFIIDDVYGPPINACPAFGATGAAANSDVLIVRHAAAQAVALPIPANAQVKVAANFTGGILFTNGAPPTVLGAATQVHNVVVNAYYVAQESDLDPNTPSLRMKSLDDTGTWVDQELVSGVENLQVQYGIDADGDGDVDRYVDGDHALVNPLADPGQIRAVRLWMLARSPIAEVGFTDPGPYNTPDLDFPQITTGTAGPPEVPSQNRRLEFSKTVFLRNNRI